MVRIRLRRVGSKRQASFRIVAADKESPRDGRFLEIIGHYDQLGEFLSDIASLPRIIEIGRASCRERV